MQINPRDDLSSKGRNELISRTSQNLSNTALRAYESNYILRAAAQAIPAIGGSIDTVLAGPAEKWKQQRIEEQLDLISMEIGLLNNPDTLINKIKSNEGFYDLFTFVLRETTKTRSKTKRERFAKIVANQLNGVGTIDDAETAANLIANLDDIDIKVLHIASIAKPCDDPFEGLPVITLSNRDQRAEGGPLDLRVALPGTLERHLSRACSKLISQDLLRDEGLGRTDARAMEHFVITPTGHWLLSWISESNPGEIKA